MIYLAVTALVIGDLHGEYDTHLVEFLWGNSNRVYLNTIHACYVTIVIIGMLKKNEVFYGFLRLNLFLTLQSALLPQSCRHKFMLYSLEKGIYYCGRKPTHFAQSLDMHLWISLTKFDQHSELSALAFWKTLP